MTMNAVAAGMTPYRPSPPPSPSTWPAAFAGEVATPSCAEDLGACFGAPSPPAALPLSAAGGDDSGFAGGPVPGFLAERQPGGWTCVHESWGTDTARARVVERYLTPAERDAYDRLSAAAQPSWLLGRVAAKDAVRWWLADRGTLVDPADVPLANESSGRPVIDADASASPAAWRVLDLRISIAHVSGTGVAIVAQGRDVGIDVEEAAPRPASFARVAFSRLERVERFEATREVPVVDSCCAPPARDLHVTMDEATWMAAAWCAKEAAGKADGTGLQGRPTRFVTRLVGPDLFTVGERLVRLHRLDPVDHCSLAGHSLVVGWTLAIDRSLALDPESEGGWPQLSRFDALLPAGVGA